VGKKTVPQGKKKKDEPISNETGHCGISIVDNQPSPENQATPASKSDNVIVPETLANCDIVCCLTDTNCSTPEQAAPA